MHLHTRTHTYMYIHSLTHPHTHTHSLTHSFTHSLTHSPTHLHSWFWGDIPRAEAEKWLLTNNNKSGTFLVRVSSSQKDSLSLSVRDGESVKHYRIRRFDNGTYYVASRSTFNTLNVSHFVCICVCLQYACTCTYVHTWAIFNTLNVFLCVPAVYMYMYVHVHCTCVYVFVCMCTCTTMYMYIVHVCISIHVCVHM